MDHTKYYTAAEYLGLRLKELGVTHLFVVPGDYNLPLLDGLALVPGLTLVNTANELNAAYAADGHARSQGLGCVVTTFLVGALSAINGTAASYAEEVPVLSVVGVPNTSQYAHAGALHHTLGNMEDITQEVDCYRPVTVYQTILRSLVDARYLIDKALLKTLSHRKPVLLEVCRDIALLPHASFGRRGEPLEMFARPVRPCNEASLAAASEAIAAWLATRKMPVIIAGRRARHYKAELLAFAASSGYAVTCTADGKSFFPEDHPQFMGTYFKAFSDPASINQVIDASDAIVFVGVHFSELTWPGMPDGPTHERAVIMYKSRAVLAQSRAFTMVPASRLLPALARLVKFNPASLDLFRSLPASPPVLPDSGPDFTPPADAPLKTQQVLDLVQSELLAGGGVDIVVDTGDCLWRTHRLRLPRGASYETQCLASNIGAGLPTGLGFSLGAASRTGHRAVVIQGDGGMQMTAQEVATYVRFGSSAVVLLINNDGYVVERYLSPIPHSSYNYLPCWAYADVVEAMCRNIPGGKFIARSCASLEEAAAAVAEAKAKPDHFCFLEMVVAPTDAAPAAGAMRREFAGAFFTPFPLYQKRLANELGRDFVQQSAGIAVQRAMSESISEALRASALAQRLSLDGAPSGGPASPAAAAAPVAVPVAVPASRAPGMPTIDSVGSMASLSASPGGGNSGSGGSPFAAGAAGGLLAGATDGDAGGAKAAALGKSPLGGGSTA